MEADYGGRWEISNVGEGKAKLLMELRLEHLMPEGLYYNTVFYIL